MESQVVLIAFICLLTSGVIGLFDGIYIHLWKYKLYYHKETRYEHNIHTVRIISIVFITYFLFVKDFGGWPLWIGILFVIIDIIALSMDVFSEKDSRSHLGGLPQIEYYIHVVANGLHFTSTALILSVKPIEAWAFNASPYLDRFNNLFVSDLAATLLPGTIIASILHISLTNKQVSTFWLKLQKRTSRRLEYINEAEIK